MIARLVSRLGLDHRGVTVIEFALVAPVMLLLLMGLSDLTYQVYMQALLDGAVQKAARDSALENNATQTNTFDQAVISMLGKISRTMTNSCSTSTSTSGTTWCSTRKSYKTFSQIAPEVFIDKNANNICDNGESFTDINGNGVWDADPGIAGQGGAEDVVRYSMSVTFPRLFPMWQLIGWSKNTTIDATTYLKNQPYDSQTQTTSKAGVCK